MSVNLHDSEITALSFTRSDGRLRLNLESSLGSNAVVLIEGVFGFCFSPFAEQNVLFDLHVYDDPSEFDGLIEVEPGHLQWWSDEQGVLIVLEASAGMEGYIVGKSVIIR